MPGSDVEYTAINYETVTVADSSIGVTASVTGGGATRRGQRALLTLETAQIRFRYDGTAPESTEGHIMDSGDQVEILGYDNINNFRAIRTGGTSGVLKVTLEGF